MPKNKMNWLILESVCYFLIFCLVLDFINSIMEGSKKNSASIIDRITLISEIEPNIIYQLEQEANQRRIDQLREQRQQRRELEQQRNDRRQQEWNNRQQQWRDQRREQQQEYRDMRRQQQERIRQREELIFLR